MTKKTNLFVMSRPKSRRPYKKFNELLAQLRKIQSAREKLLRAENAVLLHLSRELQQSTEPAEKLG